MASSLLTKISAELGLSAVFDSPRDTKLLLLQRCVRLAAYGSSTLILALYLSALGISDAQIGLFMTLTLLGDVVISLILTMVADGIGRRRMLGLGSLLMVASGVVFATRGEYWVLVLASVVGVISPSGNEIGPFKAIEESTIAHLVPAKERSSVLAWYMLLGTFGAAAGTIVTGWVVQQLQVEHNWEVIEAYRVVFWVYAVMGLVKFVLSLMLSQRCEKEEEKTPALHTSNKPTETQPLLAEANGHVNHQPATTTTTTTTPGRSLASRLLPSLTPESTRLVIQLSFLFALDSFGSGLAPASWLTYFFHRKFSLATGSLGNLFFTTNLISSASSLIAASLARRLGLVATMVLTHIPASVALALIPLPSSVALAIGLLIFRASTQAMDQAPRQAFLAAAVLPGERTAVMGIVNVVKTLSQSAGPVVTGKLAGLGRFDVAFGMAGALKIAYDLGMLAGFLGYRTREEREDESSQGESESERQQNGAAVEPDEEGGERQRS